MGHGLVGMRERAALYGGEVVTGRHTAGGFAVRVRLPLYSAQPSAFVFSSPTTSGSSAQGFA